MVKRSHVISLTHVKIELGIWMPILGSGIGISITPGTTLKSFLCDRMNIPPDYLKHHIQTILVNSQAIDDANQIHVAGGDIIALSAAMPGLAGTTLRRGSHLAEMRRAITRTQPLDDAVHAKGRQEAVVTLKLFNLVARDIGPEVLSGRILLKEKDLSHLSTHYPDLSPPWPATGDGDWIEVELRTKCIE